jgi:hypothetical protein
MSSKEMTEELESFVNKGIEEGWSGWPLKEGLLEDDRQLTCRTGVFGPGLPGRLGAGAIPFATCYRHYSLRPGFQRMELLS